MVYKLSVTLYLLLVTGSWGANNPVSKGYMMPYHHSNNKCIDSDTEYYVTQLNMCCSKCSPGQKLQRQCSEREDTQCEPCPAHQYTEFRNSLKKCLACASECHPEDQVEVRACTASTSRVCVCREELHCISEEGGSCHTCHRNTPCPIGEGVTQAATLWQDHQCEPCPPGTYSSDVSMEPCHNHTRCEMLRRGVKRAGNSKENTVCSNKVPPSLSLPTRTVTTSTEATTSVITSITARPVTAAKTAERQSQRTPASDISHRSLTPEPNHSVPVQTSTGSSYSHLHTQPWALFLMVMGILLTVALVLFMVTHLSQKKCGGLNIQHSQPPVNTDPCEKLMLIAEKEVELLPVRLLRDVEGSAGRESSSTSVKPSPPASITRNSEDNYVNCSKATVDPTPGCVPTPGLCGEGEAEEGVGSSVPETHLPVQETLSSP